MCFNCFTNSLTHAKYLNIDTMLFFYSLVGPMVVFLTIVLTLALIFIPREDVDAEKKTDDKIYDQTFIWRMCLLVLMSVAFIVALVMFTVNHLTEPIIAKTSRRYR